MDSSPAQRTSIKMLKPGMSAIVKACLVQAYKRKPYYEVCPKCGARVEEKEGKWVCKEHNDVKPAFHLIFSGVFDDGTGNIRAVFFREQAEKVLGRSVDEVESIATKDGIESFWDDFDSLGKEFLVEGRVKTNDFSKEPEILVNNVMDVSVFEECKDILKTLEK